MSSSTSFFKVEPTGGERMETGADGPENRVLQSTEQLSEDMEAVVPNGESRPDLDYDKLDHRVNGNGKATDDPKNPKATVRKKGTAKAVPKARRTKGATKKGKAIGKKKDGTGAAADAHGSPEEDGGASGADSDESDHGTYCICHGPDDHRWMICCDGCQDWFHGDCVGMDKYVGENLVQMYICPKCEDRGKRYMTRYKKLCALDGCNKPARIYNVMDASIFCTKEHCDLWWDQMVATLPQSANGPNADVLTQSDFVGLLDRNVRDGQKDGTWKLGEPPFAIADTFWDKVDEKEVLTHEELLFLNGSASDRHMLANEIVLCKKQLQLLDMASERRKRLIEAAGPSSKDMCGYDYHLDAVGASAAFKAFEESARGAAIFAAGKLDPPPPDAADAVAWDEGMTWAGAPPRSADGREWVCRAKRCKPHASWYNGMVKSVRYTIKQLAAEAKEKLDAEARVRDCAAVRFCRKMRENNWVEVVGTDEEMEG